MKKIIIPALILALLLSGCGFTEQMQTVKDEYIDPAIERYESGEAFSEDAAPQVSAPNIATNRERLTDYVPFEAVYTRADGALIDTLEPSSGYGRLLPFAGGLVTEKGEIVLDTVCSSITAASYESASGIEYLDIYILENDEGMYAVCGADGAWCTGFEYTQVLPMELGALCIEDAEAKLAVCWAEDGTQVFDTADFGELYNIQAGSITSLADCEGGVMCIVYVNGQKGYITADGTVVNRASERASFFEDALPFSNGLAAVKNNGVWGYINTEGEYVIDPAFEEAGSFVGSLAAVKKGGVWCVIDKSGSVKREFPGVDSVAIGSGFVEAGDVYYTTALEEATFSGGGDVLRLYGRALRGRLLGRGRERRAGFQERRHAGLFFRRRGAAGQFGRAVAGPAGGRHDRGDGCLQPRGCGGRLQLCDGHGHGRDLYFRGRERKAL